MSGRATARLLWQRPDGEPVEFVLDAETLVVGREDVSICIDEPLVSRQHARFERSAQGWKLVDLGSTNLTRVNGEVIRECLLEHGDEIRFGRASCRFVVAEET